MQLGKSVNKSMSKENNIPDSENEVRAAAIATGLAADDDKWWDELDPEEERLAKLELEDDDEDPDWWKDEDEDEEEDEDEGEEAELAPADVEPEPVLELLAPAPDEDDDDDWWDLPEEGNAAQSISQFISRAQRFHDEPPQASALLNAVYIFYPNMTTIEPVRSEIVLVGPQDVKDYSYKRRMGTGPEVEGTFTNYVRHIKKISHNIAVIPYVSGLASENITIAHSDLSYGDFRDCIFDGLQFNNVNFSFANFRNSVLHQVHMTNCECKRVDFRGADISQLFIDKPTDTQAINLITDIHDSQRAAVVGAIPQQLTMHDSIVDPHFIPFRTSEEIDSDIILIPCSIEDVKSYISAMMEEIIPRGQRFNHFIISHKGVEEEKDTVVIADLSLLDFAAHKMIDMANACFDESVLYGANLSGCNIVGASFRHCCLEGVNFSRCNAERAVFDDANARFLKAEGANFQAASFRRTNASFSQFKECNFDLVTAENSNFNHTVWNEAANERAVATTMVQANFTGASLQFCRGSYINCEEAIFRSSHMDNVRLEYTNAAGSKFERASMRYFHARDSIFMDAKFNYARMDYCNFSSAAGLFAHGHMARADFSYAHLDMAAFNLQNAQHSVFMNVKGDQVQFNDCDLSFAFMHNASLRGSVWKQTLHKQMHSQSLYAYMQRIWQRILREPYNIKVAEPTLVNKQIDAVGANFDRSQFHNIVLQEGHFEQAAFVNTRFTNCRLLQSNFNAVYAMHMLLLKCYIVNTNLQHANCRQAIFENCRISKLQAQNCNFKAAYFYRSTLDSANLTDSNFAEARLRFNTIHSSQGAMPDLSSSVLLYNKMHDPEYFAVQETFSMLKTFDGRLRLMLYCLLVGGSNVLVGMSIGGLLMTGLGLWMSSFIGLDEQFAGAQSLLPSISALIGIIAGGQIALHYRKEIVQSFRMFISDPRLAVRHTYVGQVAFPPASRKEMLAGEQAACCGQWPRCRLIAERHEFKI